MLLVSLLTLTLIWRLYDLLVVTTSSCVEAVGSFLGGVPFGPSLLDIFTLAFVSIGCLWFVNMVRHRKHRQSYWRRGFEALLIGFGLLTVLTWNEYVRPAAPIGQVTENVRRNILGRILLLPTDSWPRDTIVYYPLSPPESLGVHEPGIDDQGRLWQAAFEYDAPGVNEDDFPLGIFKRPASECYCWDGSAEYARELRSYYEWQLDYAVMPAEVRAWYLGQLDQLAPSPVEEDWCSAVRDLARYRL
jgi:hypothetical protein